MDPAQVLNQAAAASPSPAQQLDWIEILAAFRELGCKPITPEEERSLIIILRFNGTIHLSESSDVPHALSAEDMSKSLAIQILARWTGTTYLPEFERVEATTPSPLLASIAREVIQRTVHPTHRVSGMATIAEVSPGESNGVTIRPLVEDMMGRAFRPDRPVRHMQLQPV